MKKFLVSIVVSSAIISNLVPLSLKTKESLTHQNLKEICQVSDDAEQIMDVSKTDNLAKFVQKNLELDNSFSSVITQCARYLNQKTYDFLLNKKEKLELNSKLELSKFKDPLDLNNIISNKVLRNSFNYLINEQIISEQSKWNVVHFLMQLKILYGDTFINRSLNQIKWTQKMEAGNAFFPTGGFVSVGTDPYISCLELFNIDVFSVEAMKELYEKNQSTVSSDIYLLVHEYGHVLSIYAGLSDYQRNTINKHEKVTECKSLTIEDIKIVNFNKNASNRLAQWIEQRFNFKDKQAKEIFLSLMAPSSYGQLLKQDIYVSANSVFMEWFSEVFAYWMLTAKHDYSIRWQIANDFFMDVLPSFL